MRRTRIICMAIAAVFAMSAVAVASASAAKPELTKEGKAGVELVKKAFTGKSGAGELSSSLGTVKCSADETVEGKVTGLKTDETKVKFTGCKLESTSCQSSGAAAGEIVTNLLASELVYTNEAKKEVGIKLKPKTGTSFVKFSCGSLELEVTGEITGALTPVNTSVPTSGHFTLAFSKTSGLTLHVGIVTAPATLTDSTELKFEETAEVLA